MKKALQLTLYLTGTGAAGIGLGYLAGWYFTKTKYEEILQVRQKEFDQPDAEVASEKTYSTEEKKPNLLDTAAEAYEKTEEKVHIPTKEELEQLSLDIEHERQESRRYDALSDVYSGNPTINTVVAEQADDSVEPAMYKDYISGPQLIRFWEYTDGDFKKVDLTYFEGDDVLMDEDERIIRDIDGTIGLESLKNFGYYNPDPKVVYVRNNRLEVDFEVMRDEGSFAEQILGVQTEDTEDHKILKMKPDDD